MVKRIDVLLFNGESNVSCVRASDYDTLAEGKPYIPHIADLI